MPRRAAAQDEHLVDGAQRRVRNLQLAQVDAGPLGRDPADDGLLQRARLLEDLLQHEVLVAGLLGHHRIPEDALRGLGDGPAAEVGERDAAARDDRHLLVAEEDDVARVAEDGRHVGRHQELALADPHDQRRPVAHRHHLAGVGRVDEDHPEQPPELGEHAAHGPLQPAPVAAGPELLLDEVRDDLRVGLGLEAVAGALQALLQLQVVLDDAVVDDDQPAAAVAVRVGVLLRGPAVGGPPRVADAVLAVHRLGADDLLQQIELAGAAPHLDLAGADEGDAGRVVAAVLQAPQPVDEHRHGRLGAEIADDPAHGVRLPQSPPPSPERAGCASRPSRPCSPAARGPRRARRRGRPR